MNEQGVRKFLLALGVESKSIRSSRGWVNTNCPMAPYMHGAGIDEHPSFGISISEGRSFWLCFGCHPKATLLEGLLHNIFIMSGSYPWEAADVFVKEENWENEGELLTPVPDAWADVAVPVAPLPADVIRKFPLLQNERRSDVASDCKKYLIGRGIPEWCQNLYQIRFDQRRGCLVFALTDVTGRIFVLRERSIEEKKIWTVSPDLLGMIDLQFPAIRDVGVWFGMFLINWRKPVILVEGEIDVIRLAALGEFNSIASCTSSVSEAQIAALSATTLYLGYDADKAGVLAHDRLIQKIGDRAVLFEIDWSVAGRKDPGELKDKKELEKVLKGKRAL